ncbi:MAG: hypothetical protein M1827_005781 [Pycnora praestabilis]|nr:MAG: hypothetical protein M1827_005781 [Pycnora praestabilis]
MAIINSSSPAPLSPYFDQPSSGIEAPTVQQTIDILGLQKHIEGGYFIETDKDLFRIANPFSSTSSNLSSGNQSETRAASTTIHYLLTPNTPLGAFHRNKGRTIHTLHSGRGIYVIIHADKVGEEGIAMVETFVVGHDLAKGEKLQWIVEGGKYKASYLLPDKQDGEDSEGLLISETVIPGFEYSDHNFMTSEQLVELVTPAQANTLAWLLRKGPAPEMHELL